MRYWGARHTRKGTYREGKDTYRGGWQGTELGRRGRGGGHWQEIRSSAVVVVVVVVAEEMVVLVMVVVVAVAGVVVVVVVIVVVPGAAHHTGVRLQGWGRKGLGCRLVVMERVVRERSDV